MTPSTQSPAAIAEADAWLRRSPDPVEAMESEIILQRLLAANLSNLVSSFLDVKRG